MSSGAVFCVVCEQAPAVLYCQQDDAHLCAACDHQVHSANQLASRHQRVPFSQPAPVAKAEDVKAADFQAPLDHANLPFEDDGLFAVPDVDLAAGTAVNDEASPFNAKAILGKEYWNDDFDLSDMDPMWLDRLDVGLDRLPSDILDSLVPEAPPPNAAPAAPAAPEPAQQLAPPPAPHAKPPVAAFAPQAAHMGPMSFMPNPHMVAFAPQPTFTPQVAVKPEHSVVTVDIDNYVPRTLLPMDPAVRMQLLASRQEKLDRFREKKRNRHFKKTIRYASRKAYAEVRPRIKGRFARKDEVAAMRAAGLLPPVAA